MLAAANLVVHAQWWLHVVAADLAVWWHVEVVTVLGHAAGCLWR